MLRLIEKFRNSEKTAFTSIEGSITYKELWKKSQSNITKPRIVYGHKNPQMLVEFISAVRSRQPFIPIDTSVPPYRSEQIIEKVDHSTIEEDCFYIMFTSGSTGEPKGIKISIKNVHDFVTWMNKLHSFDRDVFINQAPLNFDLSVLEVWCGLTTNSTIWALSKEEIEDPKKLLESLRKSQGTIWVSTPSFARLCLAHSSFNSRLMPNIKKFLFCGEILPKRVAAMLKERWPKAQVFNMYGPTESTCAVTSIEITDDILNSYEKLPVGFVKQGTEVLFIDNELVIKGNGVGLGYLNPTLKSKSKFFELDGERAYRTGDYGFAIDNLIFVEGRRDTQVKVGGNRIDLLDIETTLNQADEVTEAIVQLTPKGHLKASIILHDTVTRFDCRQFLKTRLPKYMIPSIVEIVTTLPLSPTGKKKEVLSEKNSEKPVRELPARLKQN